MSQKQPPFHHLLRDLPKDLQRALHEAVAACQPCLRPRLYACDWQEELYHEAACAACEAWHSYHRWLQVAWARLCQALGVAMEFPGRRGRNSP